MSPNVSGDDEDDDEGGGYFFHDCLYFLLMAQVRADGKGCAYCIFTWVLGVTVNPLYCGTLGTAS